MRVPAMGESPYPPLTHLSRRTLARQLTGAAFALALLPAAALAAPDQCADQFLDGVQPRLVNLKLVPKTREVCATGYAALHSGLTRTPLWVAEHLTRERIAGAEAIRRRDAFHAEASLPGDERAELSDYERSGFDRGHMAPAADMGTPEAQQESFSLANMIPQAPSLNRGLWEGIEESVRGLAIQDGGAYVVTGPIFSGEKLQSLNGRVLVPTEVWKAVYVPKEGWAGVYLTQNTNDSGWQAISLAELERRAGVDAFPKLPEAVKDKVGDLPAPKQRGGRRGGGAVAQAGGGGPVAQAGGAPAEESPAAQHAVDARAPAVDLPEALGETGREAADRAVRERERQPGRRGPDGREPHRPGLALRQPRPHPRQARAGRRARAEGGGGRGGGGAGEGR